MIKAPNSQYVPDRRPATRCGPRLAAGPVTLSWTGIAISPCVYNLVLTSDHKVPNMLSSDAADSDVAAVDEQWYAQRTAGTFGDLMTAVRPYGTQVFLGNRQVVESPQRRTAYLSPGVAWQPMAMSGPIFTEVLASVPTTYQAGEQASRRAGAGTSSPCRPGIALGADFRPAHMGERQANHMGVGVPYYRDAAGHYTFSGDFGDFGLATLFENGTSLGRSPFASGQWVVSTGPADYRLTVMTNKGTDGGVQAPNWRMSTRTLTNFEFRSQRPADDDVQHPPGRPAQLAVVRSAGSRCRFPRTAAAWPIRRCSPTGRHLRSPGRSPAESRPGSRHRVAAAPPPGSFSKSAAPSANWRVRPP